MKRRTADLYAQIEARRVELGLTQAELGFRAFGKQETSAIQNIKRGSSPSYERLGALADALGFDLYFGPPRETGTIEQVMIDGAAYAHIPLHEASLAAGAGAINGSEEVLEHLAFRRDWLKRIGTPPSSAVLARAAGDSMQPTIWPGDVVMIDQSKKEIPIRQLDPKARQRLPVYALLDDGAARLKRVERPEADQVVLVSDNPDYPPQLVKLGTLQVIGKVVWWGHTAKE